MINNIEHNQSLESDDDQPQQTYMSLKTKLLTWNTAGQWSINRLFNSHGCEKAIFSHRLLTSIELEKEE